MSLDPYLHFDGDCREAFEHYRSVFGGEYAAFMSFGDGPPEMGVADEDKDKVMHVSLPIGSSVLMGSDVLDDAHVKGTNVHISHVPSSREDADQKLAKLSEGGVVTMPMADQFWGSYFGSCTDRFGVHWMLNYSAES